MGLLGSRARREPSTSPSSYRSANGIILLLAPKRRHTPRILSHHKLHLLVHRTGLRPPIRSASSCSTTVQLSCMWLIWTPAPACLLFGSNEKRTARAERYS